MNTESPAIKMDEMIKRLFHLSKKPLLNLLNALYDDNLEETAGVEYGSTEFIYDNLVKSMADLFINVYSRRAVYRYHIEFQTTHDKNIVIRMFRYGFEKAKELLDLSDLSKTVEMEFPDPRVIFIEENEKIPDILQLKIKIPKQEPVIYQVPAFKYWLYNAGRLYDMQMYLLLPLQVFKIRKHLKAKGEIDEAAYQKLIETAEETIRVIGRVLEERKVTPEDAGEMNAILVNIMEYLYGKYGDYSKIDREVKNMIKTFYDPKLVEEGKIEEGRLILLKLIKKRIDPLSNDIEEKINNLGIEQLELLAEKIFEITTEEDLRQAVTVIH
jgi:hypothetical protein